MRMRTRGGPAQHLSFDFGANAHILQSISAVLLLPCRDNGQAYNTAGPTNLGLPSGQVPIT
jgi:hypothetical protein